MGRSKVVTPSNKSSKGSNNSTRARSSSQRSKPRNMGHSSVGTPSNKGNNNDMTSSTGKKKSTKTWTTIDTTEVIATRTRGTSSSTSPATRARSTSPYNRTPLSKSISTPIPRKARFGSQQNLTTNVPASGSKRQREASVEKSRSKNEKAKAPSSSAEDLSNLNSGSGFSKKARREKELRPSLEGECKSSSKGRELKGRELRALLGIHVVGSEGEKRASKEPLALLGTSVSSEAEKKGSKKVRASLEKPAVMSSEAKKKRNKLRSSPRMEGSPEREEKTVAAPGSTNKYELRALLGTPASSETEKKSSEKVRASLGTPAVMSAEAKKKGSKLRSSSRMEGSSKKVENTETTPGFANKFSHRNQVKSQKRGRSGQFYKKTLAAGKPKDDPPSSSSSSSSSSETATNSKNDTVPTNDTSKKTEKEKAKFSAASEKPAVEESKERAPKSEENKPDTKTDESAAVKERSPSKSSRRTDEGKNVKEKEALSKEVPPVEPISGKFLDDTPVLQSLKEHKPEESIAVAEREKTESATQFPAPEQTTDKKPEPYEDSKEVTGIEAGPTVDALSDPLNEDLMQPGTGTSESPTVEPPTGDSDCRVVSIVDGSSVTFRRATDGSDPTEDVETAEALEGSTKDKKESAAHKPVASCESDRKNKISKAKRKRFNNEASSESSSADGEDSSENAMQKDMPASKQERKQSLADEDSNDEMEESVTENDAGNRNEKKLKPQKRHHHRYDPAYAGVGANRIRIAPVLERRFVGSISNQVVKSLLSEYSLAANTEVLPPIEAPYNEDEVVLKPKKTGDGSSSGAYETASKGSGRVSDEAKDTGILEVSDAPSVRKLVHDFSIPKKQVYSSGRQTKNPVDPPFLIDSRQPLALAKSLQYLPTDYKVNVLNRRTGLVLSAANAVPLHELATLLQKDSSLEPIIPPPSADPE